MRGEGGRERGGGESDGVHEASHPDLHLLRVY